MSLLLFPLMAEFYSMITVFDQLTLYSSVKSKQGSCGFWGIWRHLLITKAHYVQSLKDLRH